MKVDIEVASWPWQRCKARLEKCDSGGWYFGRCDRKKGHEGPHALERGFDWVEFEVLPDDHLAKNREPGYERCTNGFHEMDSPAPDEVVVSREELETVLYGSPAGDRDNYFAARASLRAALREQEQS